MIVRKCTHSDLSAQFSEPTNLLHGGAAPINPQSEADIANVMSFLPKCLYAFVPLSLDPLDLPS